MQEISNKSTGISERIVQVIENEHSNKNDFAKKLGYSRTQTLYDVVNGKSLPSYDFFDKFISSEFSDKYNLVWLIGGKGQMLTQPSNNNLNEASETYTLRTDRKKSIQTIPLYDFKASAGLTSLFHDHPRIIDHITIPNLPKCDGAIAVTGDSMYPILKAGDIVIYKIINNISENIFWGEMYLLSYTTSDDDMITVKFIQKSDKGPDYIKLVSQNKHHEAKCIPLEQITAMALVKASIRINTMS